MRFLSFRHRGIPTFRLLTRSAAPLIWLALAAGTESHGQTPLEWVDREKLLAGEVLFDFAGERRYQGAVRAAVLVRAQPGDVWDVLSDCESAPGYVPHVEHCELLETRDGGFTRTYRQTVKYAWFLPRFEHVFSLRYRPGDGVHLERISGPIEHMEGVWHLVPQGDETTLVAQHLELRPGLPVPRFVVGASLRRDIPLILSEVRTRAEARRAL